MAKMVKMGKTGTLAQMAKSAKMGKIGNLGLGTENISYPILQQKIFTLSRQCTQNTEVFAR